MRKSNLRACQLAHVLLFNMLKNALFLFLITVLILVFFLPSYTQLQDLKQKNSDYEVKMRGLREENAKLLKEMHLLENDPNYLEKVGRDKMGLVRKGEVIYRLVPMNAQVDSGKRQ